MLSTSKYLANSCKSIFSGLVILEAHPSCNVKFIETLAAFGALLLVLHTPFLVLTRQLTKRLSLVQILQTSVISTDPAVASKVP